MRLQWGKIGYPDEVYDYTVLFKACASARPKELARACQLFKEQVRADIEPNHFNIQTLWGVLVAYEVLRGSSEG